MNENVAIALETVLDFVERANKQDAESEVAEAAQVLTDYLNSF